jgi:hypothetical protein
MRLREREVRDAFHAAGAVNPAAAMSLESIGIDETLAVRRLKKRAVIREAAPGAIDAPQNGPAPRRDCHARAAPHSIRSRDAPVSVDRR